ncbi:MAG: ATP-binding protein, partial [Thiotrichales bacterium]|nr:ATP-binding protein [Thiotrichales bacterium]
TLFSLHVHRHRNTRPRHIQIQLVIDVLALSLLIYFTGGSSNPFIFFFLLPITFAAATLNFRQTCLITGIAAVSYTMLMFFHVPILPDSHHQQGFDIHIWGMWYGFLISSGLLAYYISRIGISIRKRDRVLARIREEQLKSDQVLALGTLAAGTAHELGTPLATMAVLAREIEQNNQSSPELIDDVRVLRQQIDQCKSILSRMAMDAGQAQADAGQPVALDQYLENIVTDWQSLQPDPVIETDIQGSTAAPAILADTTLTQAIQNVLSNAANACRNRIEYRARWDDNHLTITICDDGAGIEPVAQSQTRGLGIGLFLSRITLNRFGGELTLDQRPAPDNGTQASLHIPLENIKIP